MESRRCLAGPIVLIGGSVKYDHFDLTLIQKSILRVTLHVDPKSSSELARILESPELRESLDSHGRVIPEQRYRWDQCAKQS